MLSLNLLIAPTDSKNYPPINRKILDAPDFLQLYPHSPGLFKLLVSYWNSLLKDYPKNENKWNKERAVHFLIQINPKTKGYSMQINGFSGDSSITFPKLVQTIDNMEHRKHSLHLLSWQPLEESWRCIAIDNAIRISSFRTDHHAVDSTKKNPLVVSTISLPYYKSLSKDHQKLHLRILANRMQILSKENSQITRYIIAPPEKKSLYFFDHDGRLFFLYLQPYRLSLQRYMKNGMPIHCRQVVKYVSYVLRCLASRGIIQGSVDPVQILNDNGTFKLSNFTCTHRIGLLPEVHKRERPENENGKGFLDIDLRDIHPMQEEPCWKMGFILPIKDIFDSIRLYNNLFMGYSPEDVPSWVANLLNLNVEISEMLYQLYDHFIHDPLSWDFYDEITAPDKSPKEKIRIWKNYLQKLGLIQLYNYHTRVHQKVLQKDQKTNFAHAYTLEDSRVLLLGNQAQVNF